MKPAVRTRRGWLAPLLLWLLAGGGFVLWSALHVFHVGRIILPRGGAVAIAATIVLVATLLGGWAWLLLRTVARRAGWWGGPPAVVELPLPRRALSGSFLLALALVAYGRFVEVRWLVVRELPLGDPPRAGARALRLAVISDLHTPGWRRPWSVLAQTVNETRPDVALFLGDALNRAGALPELRRVLAAIDAPLGKYAVRGNWDVWYWRELPLLEGTGFTWLDDRVIELAAHGQHVRLVGLAYGDDDAERARAAKRLLHGAAAGAWRVLLYHTPDLALSAAGSADLYLAGHTHGGQIALPGYGALVTLSRHGRRFQRGLSRVGDMRIYVNPGIGVEPIIPLRLGVRPEVTLVLLGPRPSGGSPTAAGR